MGSCHLTFIMVRLSCLMVISIISVIQYCDSTAQKEVPHDREKRTVDVAQFRFTDTVYTGVFDPSNILIHVTQNFINFAAGSVAWLILGTGYEVNRSGTWQLGRKKKKRDLNQQQEETNFRSVFTGKRVANVFRAFADTVETFDRFFDEL